MKLPGKKLNLNSNELKTTKWPTRSETSKSDQKGTKMCREEVQSFMLRCFTFQKVSVSKFGGKNQSKNFFFSIIEMYWSKLLLAQVRPNEPLFTLLNT